MMVTVKVEIQIASDNDGAMPVMTFATEEYTVLRDYPVEDGEAYDPANPRSIRDFALLQVDSLIDVIDASRVRLNLVTPL
jgi:hypothetical protein